jgi:hypothetical protein
MQKLLLFILIISATVAISACGIKPKTLDAPDAGIEDQFPNTYPYSPPQSK